MNLVNGANEPQGALPPTVPMPGPLGPLALAFSMVGIAAAALLFCAAAALVLIVAIVAGLGRDGATDLVQQLKFDGPLDARVGAGVVSVLYIGLAASTVAAAILRGGRRWPALVALLPIRAGWPVRRDMLGIAVVTLGYIALSTYAAEHARDHSLLVSGPTDVLLIATIVGNLVIFAPIAEELLFRGWLYTALRRRFTFWPSFLATLVVFAGIHWDAHHSRIVQVLPLAVALGLLRERAGSIKPTIALHAIYNLIIIAIRLAYT